MRLPRALRLFSVAAFVAPGLLAQEPAAPAPPTFTATTEMVVVDAVVTAKDGGPVPGLKAEDFRVLEDGVPQTIASFEPVDVSAVALPEAAERFRKVSVNTGLEGMSTRSFVLVFDQDHLSPLGAGRARAAAAQFLRFGPREGDTITLVATGGGSWWVTRAEEAQEEVAAILKRLQGRYTTQDTPDRISDWEAMRIYQDRDPVTLEQVRRRFETYVTGRSRSAEGIPVRASDRVFEGKEFVGESEIYSRAQDAYNLSVVRNRATLSALQRVLESMAVVRGRKTAVLFSEGFIRDPRMDEYDQVLRAAQRSNVAVYFVDVRGLAIAPESTAQFGTVLPAADVTELRTQEMVSAQGADNLADRTGGFAIKNTNDLERGLKRVAQEARRYYLLGYAPADAKRDGRWRKIQVEVARPDVQVRARQGYFAPGGKKGTDRWAAAWQPGWQQALDSPYEFQGIPVRLTDHVFGEAAAGKARALISAEVDIRALAFTESGGKAVDTLESMLLVVNRDTGEVLRHDQKLELKLPPDVRSSLERRWLPVSKELELPAGGYQARLVLRDKNNGTVGSVRHDFDVPDLSAWRTSSPVLSDALEPKVEGEPLRLVVPARRAFAPGGTLYFQFEVYGSRPDPSSRLPRVSSGFLVRNLDGSLVSRGPSAPIKPTPEGRLARIGMFPLEGLPPGRYDLVLDVRDEVAGRTLEVVEPFAVEVPTGTD